MNTYIQNKISLPAFKNICKKYDVENLYLFGSCTYANDDSPHDVDLVVQFTKRPSSGAFNQFMGLKEELESFFCMPVDILVERTFRNKLFAEQVEAEKTLLYAA